MFHFILPSFNFNIEKWKWNSDYRVYVSNFGHFKDEYKKSIPVRINNSGYVAIKTAVGFKLAHRLVMLTWCPIPDAENLTVDHLDHNKRNNSVKNLEWVTETENLKRAKNDQLNSCKKQKKQKKEDNSLKEIKCLENNFVFKNSFEAAEWVVKNQTEFSHAGPNQQTTLTKVAKRILQHAENPEANRYCRLTWELVK